MEKIEYEAEIARKRKKAFADASCMFKKYADTISDSGEMTYELNQFDLVFKKKAEMFGVQESELLEQCKAANLLSSVLFFKDPSKQSAHQDLAVKFLKKEMKKYEGFCDFELLRSSGPGALYVKNGKVVKSEEMNESLKNGKSIDFKWEFKDKRLKESIVFYGSHKYTKEDGGSQDNQRNDLVRFIEKTAGNRDKNVYFFAIADGAYYDKKTKSRFAKGDEIKTISRLEELNNYAIQAGSCSAVKSEDVLGVCIKIVESRMLEKGITEIPVKSRKASACFEDRSKVQF